MRALIGIIVLALVVDTVAHASEVQTECHPVIHELTPCYNVRGAQIVNRPIYCKQS